MIIGCDACGALLSDWMDDDLEEEERRALERHLATCAFCRERLRAYRRIRRAFRALPRPEPPRSIARTFHVRLAMAASSPAFDDGRVEFVEWDRPPA